MALLHVNFFSNVLGMCMQMDVILPQKSRGEIGIANIDKPLDTYPVLYLFHGFSDDHTIWQRRTSIERYAAERGIAVVMPTTHRSWYTDMANGCGNYFQFIANEVPAVCHDLFPKISQKREDNFVAGLSMGGYGALKIALRHPERFAAAASLSGALNVADINRILRLPNLWDAVFGKEIEGSDNDVYYLAEKVAESGKPKPKIYMWCGLQDGLISDNRKMKETLIKHGYDLDYFESDGDHSWKYWDEQIEKVIKWLPIQK